MTIGEKLQKLREAIEDCERIATHYKKARKSALEEAASLRERILDIEEIRDTAECPVCLGKKIFPQCDYDSTT